MTCLRHGALTRRRVPHLAPQIDRNSSTGCLAPALPDSPPKKEAPSLGQPNTFFWGGGRVPPNFAASVATHVPIALTMPPVSFAVRSFRPNGRQDAHVSPIKPRTAVDSILPMLTSRSQPLHTPFSGDRRKACVSNSPRLCRFPPRPARGPDGHRWRLGGQIPWSPACLHRAWLLSSLGHSSQPLPRGAVFAFRDRVLWGHL